jgi:hypothetical protein
MWLDPKRYEIMDDQMAEIMRLKTPDEKLTMLDGMWRMARELIQSMLWHDHPDWSDEQINKETAPRMSRGATDQVYAGEANGASNERSG